MVKLELAEPLVPVVAPAMKKEDKPVVCGFCSTGNCTLCPHAVRGMGRAPKIWPCACARCGQGQVLRCLECKNPKPDEVDPKSWTCYDKDYCTTRHTARLAANPAVQQMNGFKETAMARVAKTAAAKTAAPARTPKADTFCLVTGEKTSGGLFKPGMDARYVSQLVAQVVDRELTAVQARKKMKDDGVSETLIAKFEKAVDLKRAAAAKAKEEAAAAKAAKPAAPAAKPARPAKRAAAKPAPEPEVEDDEADEDETEGDDDF